MSDDGDEFKAWAEELMKVLARDMTVATEAGAPKGLRFGLSADLHDFWRRSIADRERSAGEIEKLSAELAEARRDAERYRFLIDGDVDWFQSPGGYAVIDWMRGHDDVSKDDLDAAIDRAMERAE